MYIGGHETRQDAHRRFSEHAIAQTQHKIKIFQVRQQKLKLIHYQEGNINNYDMAVLSPLSFSTIFTRTIPTS